VIVVADAELPTNQLSDHRPGPDSRRETGSLRTRLDHGGEHRQLALIEFVRRARWLATAQPIDAVSVVPEQPLVDAAARSTESVDEVKDPLTVDVRENGARAAPLGHRLRVAQESS